MRNLNLESTADELALFIKKAVVSSGFSQVVIAVSGGVDSATSASLAVKALGIDKVYGLLLPYKNWQPESVSHACIVLKQLAIPDKNIFELNVGRAVDSLKDEIRIKDHESSEEPIRLGNIMARVRMIILFDYAKKLKALVLGTENKSEHLLGYYTRFGDEASDIEPLRNLYKTEVVVLAKYLKVPAEIIDEPPTAGLWPGQTDEGQFGFTYKQADEILYRLFDLKQSEPELIKQGINKNTLEKVKSWIKSMEFKHRLPLVAPEGQTR